jgi:drug/metabolite transporter (DMT)-like permease
MSDRHDASDRPRSVPGGASDRPRSVSGGASDRPRFVPSVASDPPRSVPSGGSDHLLLPVFVLLWSSGYVVGALAVEVADPLPLLAARFVLAALVMVPLALRHGRWRGAPLGRLAVVGLLLHVVQFGGIYGGFALGVPAALSALVMLGLSPLVTTALAVASGQERADGRLWAGLAVGVIGVAISLAPELGSAGVGGGVALTILGMLGLSGGTVLQKRWVGVADPRVAAAVQSVTAAVVVAPAAAVFGGRFDLSAQLVLSVGWIAVGMGVVSFLALIHVLRGHAASSVAALLLVVPPVTAAASALALGETLHPASGLGMVVALVGVGAVLRREGQRTVSYRSSIMPDARGRTSVGRIGGPGTRRSNSGFPLPSTTGTTVTQTSSSRPASAN